jgi:hypothetical protein
MVFSRWMKFSRRSRRTDVVAALIGLAALAGACRREEAPPGMVVRSEWPMPDDEQREPCADVGALRACWGDATSARIVPRRAPPLPPSSLGFRTLGRGKGAKVVDRARYAPPFECDQGTCRQRNPRLPDDGEWECADFAAVAVCHGGSSPAGVPAGGADGGYQCGTRKGPGVPAGERVCVDLSPDMPPGAPRGRRCRFDAEHGLTRVCRQDAGAQSVTDACVSSTDCATGLLCVSERCVPRLPAPSCWLDRDCGKGSCRFGSCLEDGA